MFLVVIPIHPHYIVVVMFQVILVVIMKHPLDKDYILMLLEMFQLVMKINQDHKESIII